MTDNDLRMDYKRDTGLEADTTRVDEIEINQELTIRDLRYPVDIEFVIKLDEIPYVDWLEEKLIKLLAK